MTAQDAQYLVSYKAKLTFVARERFQLGGCLVVAVLLPVLAKLQSLNFDPAVVGKLDQGAMLTGIAVIGGHVLIRQMTSFPGARAAIIVFPAFGSSFGFMAAFTIAAQMSFALSQLLVGFLIANVWYFAVCIHQAYFSLPRLGVVPIGCHRDVLDLPCIEWFDVPTPTISSLAQLDGLVVDLHAKLSADWEHFMANAIVLGTPVYDARLIHERFTGMVSVTNLFENAIGTMLPSRGYAKVKDVLDAVSALLMLPFFAVVIGIASVIIKLEGRGPAFFVQTRIGFRGRPFKCYKLRSMCVQGERKGASFTSQNDPRVTKFGRILRKYRIDEFPQIINILKGEMSWIGPRPEAVRLAEWYEREIPFYRYRHAVKPGITGWAAVNQGNVAELDAATTKLKYDFYYIKNFSAALDLVIIAKTVWAISTGFGAK